jgi:hypothetical protein
VQKKTEAIQHIGWSINRSDKAASFEFVLCLLMDHPKTIPVKNRQQKNRLVIKKRIAIISVKFL